MRKNRFISLCLAGTLGLGLLTGCSEKNVDYDIDDTQQNQSGAQTEGDSTLAQFADAEPWKENWKATNGEGDTYDISISADISVPETDQMSVVEVKETKMDAAYKEKIVETLFPDETVYYYDEEHWPKKKLQEEIEHPEEEIRRGDFRVIFMVDDMEEAAGEYEHLEEENTEPYMELLKDAPSDYMQAEDYDGDAFMVISDGIAYRFWFVETSALGHNVRQRSIEMKWGKEGDKIPCPEELKGADNFYWDSPVDEVDGNRCSLTEKEAQAVAERTLSSLGFTNFVLEETVPMAWAGYSGDHDKLVEDDITDGWVMSYGTGVDEVSFRQSGAELDYYCDGFEEFFNKVPEEGAMYSMDTGIKLKITDDGVIGMTVSNPVEVTAVTKDVELLPLESIQTIMRNELTENIDDYPYLEKTNYYTDLELIYFRIRDREKKGYYSYVPVWRLSVRFTDSQGNRQIERPVLVNAIDGSVIHLEDEFCGAAE